jgi:hypothetical protein
MTSATFAIGRIREFENSQEDIDAYIERLEHWMTANKIDGPPVEEDRQNAKDQRVSVLLTVIGAKSYGVLRNLLTPDKPDDKTYAELVATLKSHFKPKSLVIAERFRFYKREQNEGEAIAAYIVALKQQARRCNFGAS